jgi:NADPH2:quinone reductase
VAYATSKPGAYAQRRVVPSNILVPLPDALSFDQVASLLLRGLTAQCLLRQVARTQAGDTILVHAAAGGVGTLLVQWAKALGAMVIGTVGSRAKGALARSRGCDHVIVRTEEDLVSRVRALTSGNGVDVVFDSVGRDSFIPSLDCLRRHGLMVNYGSTSGLLEHINPIDLTRRGSLRFIRPTVSDYVADPGVLAQMAAELFNEVLNGRISLDVPSRYAMADVVLAHHAVDSGQTMGAIVLLP